MKKQKITKEQIRENTKFFNSHTDIVIFDVETTGLHAADGDNIIELGGIRYQKKEGKFVEEEAFNFLIKQDEKLNEEIVEITGITDEILEKEGVDEEVVYNYFKNFMNDKNVLLSAYNMQFDITFIHYLMRKYEPNFEITNNIFDVFVMYKDHHSYPWKLEEAMKRYNVEGVNSHRASDDAKATWNLLKTLMTKGLYQVDAYVNVIGYSQNHGLQGIKLDHVKYVEQMGKWRKILRIYEGETDFPEEKTKKKYRTVAEREATAEKTKAIFEEHSKDPKNLLDKLIENEIWLSKDGPIEIKDMNDDHIIRLEKFCSTGVEKYGKKSNKWSLTYEEQRYKVDIEDYFNGFHKKFLEHTNKKGD